MKQTRKVLSVLAVSSCLFFSAPAIAQTGDGTSTTTTSVSDDADDDDDNGKIGLAGLLGLLGLLGLRKKDDHRHTTTVRRD
jgi:MYXO-CTERM domain-containing protein